MSRFMKKALSVVLAVTLGIACFLPAYAQADDCLCGNNPILIVTGFSEYNLVDHSTGNSVWMPETDAILNAVQAVLPSLAAYLVSSKTQSDAATLCDTLIPAVNELFDPIACNPNGEVKHTNVGLVNQFTESVAFYGIDTVMATEVCDKDIVKSACNAVGADHVWVYGLDWRIDPLVLADEIHEYVEYMKETTGHSKISISGISMGGIVMASYLAKYGTDDVTNITMMSSAFTGLEMVGQLFTGKIAIDENGLYNIISDSIGGTELSSVLELTGLLSRIIPVLDDLLEYQGDRIYSECLVPNFGYNTGLWSFVPDEYFADAKEYMGQRMSGASASDLAEFWARVDAYHNDVQLNVDDILKTAKKDGIFVSVVSNYNLQMPPVTQASDLTGDQVIETIHTSGFATVAKQGSTLGEGYKRTRYLSQDRMIDSSTCYLPENTWFIKNQKHVEFSETDENDNGAFYAWLLTAKEQYDIDSNVKYPQFLTYDAENKVLSRLSNVEGDITGDMLIKTEDVRLILQQVTQATELTESQQWAADRNYDSEISLADAKLTLMQAAG